MPPPGATLTTYRRAWIRSPGELGTVLTLRAITFPTPRSHSITLTRASSGGVSSGEGRVGSSWEGMHETSAPCVPRPTPRHGVSITVRTSYTERGTGGLRSASHTAPTIRTFATTVVMPSCSPEITAPMITARIGLMYA